MSVYYHKLVRQIQKYYRKKYLIVDENILNQVTAGVIKLTWFEKFDNNEISIGAGDKLPDHLNLKEAIFEYF